jgi:hypothetical protein
MRVDKIAPAAMFDAMCAIAQDDGDLTFQVNMVAALDNDYDQTRIQTQAKTEERIESLTRALVRALRRELANADEE